MEQRFELAPYHGLDLRGSLDIATYRLIMHFSMWLKVRRAIVVTRAYEAGISSGLALLTLTDQFSGELTPKENNDSRVHLYELLLDCLDRLDRWEEYLDLWNKLHQNARLETPAYVKSVVRTMPHAERDQSFILRETPEHVYFHFLRNTARRKEKIEQKLARKSAGRKIGNLLHRSPEELSEIDIRERLQRLKGVFAHEEEMKRYWQNYWRNAAHSDDVPPTKNERKPNQALQPTRAQRKSQ